LAESPRREHTDTDGISKFLVELMERALHDLSIIYERIGVESSVQARAGLTA
jgi:hypothetical protein